VSEQASPSLWLKMKSEVEKRGGRKDRIEFLMMSAGNSLNRVSSNDSALN
jgi:hypothetical protein